MLPKIAPGNIWSGSRTLAVLTNPTELARRKGNLRHSYPITYRGRVWPDVEAAFHAHKAGKDFGQQQALVTDLVEAKLQQHPRIAELIAHNGGIAWLRQCSHYTRARTPAFQRWEGDGEESAFVRCLIAAYQRNR